MEHATGYYVEAGCFSYDGIIITNNVACNPTNNFAPAPGESVGSKLNSNRLYLAYGASTTGTIYGIYDMSGGKWDKVMAMYKPDVLSGIKDCNGYSTNYAPPMACPNTGPYNSQYDLLKIDEKYYDRYLSTSLEEGYIKGDATYETAGWYDDIYEFYFTADSPWLIRSALSEHGEISGVFTFCRSDYPWNDFGFRIVLLNGAGL